MVLVLLPGGRVPKANSASQGQEDWITTVDLVPFFLSKYELTSEQWDRFSPRPSRSYAAGGSLEPVNHVSWDEVSLAWPRELGWCDFPSPAQWEFGCRSATTSSWWTGNTPKDLVGVANTKSDNGVMSSILAIGSLRANAFGLHDVHGNVWEWCGGSLSAEASLRLGARLSRRDVSRHDFRSFRGGSWISSQAEASSSLSHALPSNFMARDVGIRPARRITP